MGGNATDHVYRLSVLWLKRYRLAFVCRRIFLDVLFKKIVTSTQWQTGPAALDHLEQADGNDVLCPRVAGLILFGGMVEDLGTPEDLLSCLGIDITIKNQDQPAVGFSFRNHIPQPRPQPVPGNLRGGHEAVVSFPADVGKTKQGCQCPQEIGCSG